VRQSKPFPGGGRRRHAQPLRVTLVRRQQIRNNADAKVIADYLKKNYGS